MTTNAPATSPPSPTPDLFGSAPAAPHAAAAPVPAGVRPRARRPWRVRLLRGPAGDPAWARPALLVLLATTALLYLWGLGASGWANAYYSAAARAGAQSWKAWFFGSLDPANSITVDKTPASLWVIGLSARLFGVNAWSILVPQALAGVASVGLLYAAVRRWFGPGAGLLAGAVFALTPVAVLLFRFNNPDALLVLLLVAAAYAVVRAVEHAAARWLVLAGCLVGLGFLTKMLQALLVVPAFAVVYLIAAPTSIGRRLGHLAGAGLALLAAAGWWVALVELWPAASRPYIGGSQTNSVLELALGYNGLGRLTGEEIGSVGGGRGWGETGWTRLFDAENGGQAAWLLPAALILLVAGLVLTRRAPHTDRTRAALLLWGGWLLVTGAVFSLMQGIYHAYYTVALAPAIGGLVGVGSAVLFRRRRELPAALTLAGATAVTALWACVLLGRSPDWQPWLRPAVLVVGLLAAAALAAGMILSSALARLAGGVAVVAALAAPLGYALDTAATPHTGAIPSAGPAAAGALRGPGGPGPGPAPGTVVRPDGRRSDGAPALPPGDGLLNAGTPSAELTALLKSNADGYTWVAAAVGANNAAGYQLATGEPVMAIGGFNGSDPSPTLAQFQRYVAEGRIHYFLGGGGMRANGAGASAQQIAGWVAENYPAVTVAGVTVYDLTDPS